MTTAVAARGVGFSYGSRPALDGIDFEVETGSTHALLGPNGSGKSTLFKILATILPPQKGEITALGHDLRRDFAALRHQIGVVFQAPALDRKLSVERNLKYAGNMYGLSGAALQARIDELLDRGGLIDRRRDPVGSLSGGLKRRVELAKGLLPKPAMLILDEPTTGLDPSARRDLWRFLAGLSGVTVLVTTHLMEEAELAGGITILDRGRVVATGSPHQLRASLPGGPLLEIRCTDPDAAQKLAADITAGLGRDLQVIGAELRLQSIDAHRFAAEVADRYAARFDHLQLGHASLEEVFIRATGHRFAVSVADGEDHPAATEDRS